MGTAKTAISIRNGPVQETSLNGVTKSNGHHSSKRARPSLGKSYKEDSGSDREDEPLVSRAFAASNLLT